MKKPISATIDKEVISWIERELRENKRYRNKSHIIETALELLRASNEDKKRSETAKKHQKGKK